MATVTVTCQASLDQPRDNYRGALVGKKFSSGNVTFGAGTDVMRLAKLPHGATVVDVVGDVQCAATSVQGVLVVSEVLASGTLSTRATLCSISAVTAGGPIKTGRFVPYTISLSDDAAVQHAMLAIVVSGGTQSTSFSILGTVVYETSGS
jgi:hypothetical protein